MCMLLNTAAAQAVRARQLLFNYGAGGGSGFFNDGAAGISGLMNTALQTALSGINHTG